MSSSILLQSVHQFFIYRLIKSEFVEVKFSKELLQNDFHCDQCRDN